MRDEDQALSHGGDHPASLNGSRRPPMRILFALPGLHRVARGAEIAFESVAAELAQRRDCEVTLIGSGQAREDRPYRFIHAPCRPRERFERWPRFPVLRDHYIYEELTFIPGLWSAFDPAAFDVTVTCSYPFVNWALRAKRAQGRPRHIFVTQNGDWPAHAAHREYRYFSCDGLICTNPEFLERNQRRWRCRLIANGVDAARFRVGPRNGSRFGIPTGARLCLIVSALIPSKRVLEGIRTAAAVPGLHLLLLGDGELRDRADALGHELMPGRFRRATVPYAEIPSVYAAADVLLHMSKDEPFGNVYIEAMAAGVPVVAHQWAGTRWILKDRAALVDTDDPVAVAAAITAAIGSRSPIADETRRQYIASRFDWRIIAAHYAEFFRAVMEAP
jgi:glycosyltransferase involved in cell wall biosynthesis